MFENEYIALRIYRIREADLARKDRSGMLRSRDVRSVQPRRRMRLLRL